MTTRQNLLNQTWTGAPILIAGRELVLSPVRYALLEYWKNCLFASDESKQNPAEGMGELLYACWATKDEIKAMQRMTPAERRDCVMEFMIDNEDEIGTATVEIEQRMKSVKASSVESTSPGKPDAALASSPA